MKYSFQETGRKINEMKDEIEIPIDILKSRLENMKIKMEHIREIHRRTTYVRKKFDPPYIVKEEIKEEIKEKEKKELEPMQIDEKSDNEFTKSRKNINKILLKNSQNLDEWKRSGKKDKRKRIQ